MSLDPTLDCQDCGVVLKHLTAAEAQLVANYPQNFIVRCPTCEIPGTGGNRMAAILHLSGARC